MRITEKLFCIALIGSFVTVNNVCAEDKAKVAPKPEVVKKAEELPENIKLIIGQGKTKNYYIRVRAIHRLLKNLPQYQVDAIYKFLYTRLEKQKLKNLEFNGLKNEVVVKLIRQNSTEQTRRSHT